MAFLNKLFSSGAKKKEPKSDSEDEHYWKRSFLEMPENCGVRVVLFRECDRKGKKLLFDSSTVERLSLEATENKDQFIESCDGWGYKYLHPPARDVKILNDMIFGGAGLMHPSPNMKLHHLGDHSLMWSSVLQAPHPTRPTKASDQSLGSSFGCSFG